MTGFEDAIVAIATAPGRGALAIVRVSGARVRDIADALCPELAGSPLEPRKQRLLRIVDPASGAILDRGLVTWFPAPNSYTGDDVVELSLHGGAVVSNLVVSAILSAGARNALPGEFTRRAMLNGKLDLLQAEAVIDLVEGSSPALHRSAVQQLERGLSTRIEGLRAELLRIEALISYGIDFPEEDEPPVPPARIHSAVAGAIDTIERMLATVPHGLRLREGALVVFAGYPNAGKSSLFNAMLGIDRAIVTDIPGTTRDAIEADLLIEGYPFRLVDTAGMRKSDDTVEALGVEVAKRYLSAADVVVFCRDLSRSIEPEERAFVDSLVAPSVLLVGTKADRVARNMEREGGQVVPVSVITGVGLDELRGRLLRAVFGGIVGREAETPLVTRERHARALEAAAVELREFSAGLDAGVSLELLATHLRVGIGSLEGLIGTVTSEDVFDAIFSQFCVGK